MQNDSDKVLINRGRLLIQSILKLLLLSIGGFLFILFIFWLGEYVSNRILEGIVVKTSLNPKNIYLKSLEIVLRFGLASFFLISVVDIFTKRPKVFLGLKNHNALKKVKNGFLFGGLLVTLVCFIILLLGQAQFKIASHISFSLFASVLIMIPTFFIQGGTEELLFRGWLLQIIKRHCGVKSAVFISSFLFAFLHILLNVLGQSNNETSSINLWIIFVFSVNVFQFGVLFCLIRLKQRSIYTDIGIHTAVNWFQQSGFGLALSGVNFNESSIITVIGLKPSLITGSFLGIEGSLITTILLFIIILLYLQRKKGSEMDFIKVFF